MLYEVITITRGGDVSLFPGVSLSEADYGSATLGIGSRRATMSPGHATFSLGSKQVKVVTSSLGRVRFCSLSGTSIAGMAAC